MNSPAISASTSHSHAPAWLGKLPNILLIVGGLGAVAGAFLSTRQFGYSYLLAFMFYLSICLGSLFLVILHHLFDAHWSVPIRRFVEHLAATAPIMGLLFIPILINVWTASPENLIFPWMNPAKADHALHVKEVIFNKPAFTILSVALFVIWTLMSFGFRRASLAQDKDGAAKHTLFCRKLAAGGVFIFAFSLTLGAILWMKSLQHQFFSTMYGVYYFAGSVWLTLATVYVIALALKKTGPLAPVVKDRQILDIAVLLFAFTVFYAYIHFSQYFLIWNAAIPEETFWYVLREKGSWYGIGMLLIFGHFVLPFLALLRIDAKLNLNLMIPLCAWVWLMHFCDMSFNIMPVMHPDGFYIHILDLACMAFMGGLLAKIFLKSFAAHPPYPQRDPRIAETMGVYVEPAKAHGGAK